jgi:hypothetical protein
MVTTIKLPIKFESLDEKLGDFVLSLTRIPATSNIIFTLEKTDIELLYMGNKTFRIFFVGKKSSKMFLNEQFIKTGVKLISKNEDNNSKNN